MQYFIYGNQIKMHTESTTGGFPCWEIRRYIPSQEILAAYPQSDTVKLFLNEEDAINFCNSINEHRKSFIQYLRPIFVVECEEIDEALWNKTEIKFDITEYTKRAIPSNKHTHDEETVNKTSTMYIADVQLSSLQPIKGTLKSYYDVPGSQRIKGSTDFQPSYQKQCAIL